MLGHVLSPVRFLPRHSFFADCKLYIRTRLLASASSNFWKTPFDLLIFILAPLFSWDGAHAPEEDWDGSEIIVISNSCMYCFNDILLQYLPSIRILDDSVHEIVSYCDGLNSLNCLTYECSEQLFIF